MDANVRARDMVGSQQQGRRASEALGLPLSLGEGDQEEVLTNRAACGESVSLVDRLRLPPLSRADLKNADAQQCAHLGLSEKPLKKSVSASHSGCWLQ